MYYVPNQRDHVKTDKSEAPSWYLINLWDLLASDIKHVFIIIKLDKVKYIRTQICEICWHLLHQRKFV